MGAMTIEHEGTTYPMKVGTIAETRLGTHDRGFISAALHVNFDDGFSVTIDPYALDRHGEGTAFGMDYLLRIMDTVRVDKWEDLASEDIAVLFSPADSAIGFASTNGRRVLLFTEYSEAWKSRHHVSAAEAALTPTAA